MDAKAWYKSKIVLVALITAALGAVEVTLPTVKDSLPPATFGWLTMILAIVIAIFRVLSTTQSIIGADAVKDLNVKAIAKAVVGKE